MNTTEENKNNEETLSQELRGMMSRSLKNFLNWLKPNPREPWYVDALRYLYKIPAVILAVFLSPIALVILIFAFIVAF